MRSPSPDLITGCVAVGRDGFRLVKGGGYGEKYMISSESLDG